MTEAPPLYNNPLHQVPCSMIDMSYTQPPVSYEAPPTYSIQNRTGNKRVVVPTSSTRTYCCRIVYHILAYTLFMIIVTVFVVLFGLLQDFVRRIN